MSLINQMLRDLESRRTPPTPAGTVLGGSTATRTARTLRPTTLVLLLLVVLLALGLGYTLWQQRVGPMVPQSTTPDAVSAVPLPATSPAGESVTTTLPRPATTVITPRLPEQVKAMQTQRANATASIAHLTSITPQVIDGSWQARSLTLRGEALGANLNIVVSWDGKEKLLNADSVEWVDRTTARIKLVTGNSDALWQVALVHPDGSRSEALSFEVIASPSVQQAATGTSGEGRMEKVIRPPSPQQQADQLYQQGYQALQQRNADTTDTLWQQALRIEPDHSKSREGLIALYLSQGRKVEASKLLVDGIARNPENGNFALLHARLLAEQGNTALALATLEQAMGSAEQQPQLFALAAALYQQQRDYSRSITAYQRALQLQPQQSTWWMGIGISLEGAGKTAEAKSAYSEALQRGMLSKESQAYVQQRLQELE